MTTEPAKPGRRRGCMIAVAAVVLLLVCGALAALFMPGSDESAAPAATEPAATQAVIQPTETQEPTEPPQPTDTPRPTATAADVAPAADRAAILSYLTSINEISQVYKDALDGLTAQSAAAAADPNVILTEDWKVATAAFLAVIRLANDEFRALDPPAILQPAHADVVEAAGHYDTMTTLYAEGVDEVDMQKLAAAAESMTLGNQAIQRATEKIAALAP